MTYIYRGVRMNPETVKSIDNIARMDAEMQELADIARTIFPLLHRKRRNYLRAGGSFDGLGIHLSAAKYPRAFKARLDRCAGIDITWLP